ncbi:MAG: hypothetical protein WBE90_01365 [Xanthobacteraceae bacterium]
MSAQTTRRSLVAGAAALPVLAVPALAAVDNPDAELLRLGTLLAPLMQERAAQMAIDRARRDIFEAEVVRRTGIAFKDAPEITELTDLDVGYWAVRKEVSIALCQDDEDEDENGDNVWDRIHSRLWPIARAILSEQATTLEGLKVQAKVACFVAADRFDFLREEWDDEMTFVARVCSYLGIDAEATAMGRA